MDEPLETPPFCELAPAPFLIEKAETKTSVAHKTVDVLETPRCSGSTLAPIPIEEAETKTASARETSTVPATTLIQSTVRGSALNSDAPPVEVPSGTTWATGIRTCDDEVCIPSPHLEPDAQSALFSDALVNFLFSHVGEIGSHSA